MTSALTATGIGFAPATSVLAVCGGLDVSKHWYKKI
jgi:hypothetical protein